MTYNSRLTSDGLLQEVKRTGRLDEITFAAKYEPCKSFFKKAQSVFQATRSRATAEKNVGVTFSVNFPGLSGKGDSTKDVYGPSSSKIETLATRTDTATIQFLDPETLEPIGLADQSKLHPDLKGVGSGAHAEVDPATGDVFNYNLDYGRQATYKLWRTSASTGQTSILASFNHTPSYLHSLFMTENYVILCVWNSFYAMGGALIPWKKNLLEAMAWDGSKPCTWFVVDKTPTEKGGKGLVATYESEAMFCFHTINAFEETTTEGQADIIADLAAYVSMDVISKFYYKNLVSDSPNAAKWSDPSNDGLRPTYRRYRLPKVPTSPTKQPLKATCEYQSRVDEAPELPIIAPSRRTKPYRYVYGVNDSGKSSFLDSLVKYDVETHTVKKWSKHGHTAGEPIFVPNPQGTEEDDGVLLTVVLDGMQGKSYLMCLDARDLTELAKAHTDGVVGMAFHGLFVS